jgi:hypothetical protein
MFTDNVRLGPKEVMELRFFILCVLPLIVRHTSVIRDATFELVLLVEEREDDLVALKDNDRWWGRSRLG